MGESELPRTRYCSRCLTTFPSDVDRCTNLGCRSGRPAAGWGELLETGEFIDRTYRVHRRLAIGGAGVTYLARELGKGDVEFGPLLAIKVLYQQRDQGPYLSRLQTEAQILQRLNHPQIVECRGFVHRSGHSPYLVTKFENGGSLLDQIRRVGLLSPVVTAQVGRQVCWALEVAHRQGVIHRDLKPENVLLEEEVAAEIVPAVRVADFGIAKVFGGVGDRLTRVGAFVGTPQYAAPEQFEGVAPVPATDVYAVGALLYFCMTACPIADFMAELDPDSQREHLIMHLPPKLPDLDGEMRRWFEDTLAMAMAVDPGDRCTIDVLEARLAAIATMQDPGPATIGGVSSAAAPHHTITLPPASLQPLTTGGVASLDAVPLPTGGGVASPPQPTKDVPVTAGGVSAPGVSAGGVAPAVARAGSAADVVTPPVAPVGSGSPPVTRTAPTPPAPAPTAPTPTAPGIAAPKVEVAPPILTPEVPRRKARAESGSGGLLGCGFVTLVGAAAIAVIIGVGAWFYLHPEVPLLTGGEADANAQRDWQLVASKLGDAGVVAERACHSPAYLAMEVTVAGDGKVQAARLLNYPHEPTRQCIERELKTVPFPRAQGAATVRVAVTMVK